MKKTIILFSIFIFSFISVFAEESYVLTVKDKILINNTSTKINRQIDLKGDTTRSKYVAIINKLLKKYKKNTKIYEVLTGIKTKIINHTSLKVQNENKAVEVKNDPKVTEVKPKIVKVDIKTEDKKETEKNTDGKYKAKTNFSDYKIDMNRVRDSWLGYYNGVRKIMGRTLYLYDSKLNDTAQEWSDTSLSRGIMSHKRDTNDSYYNYKKITSWFADRGVVCSNINGATNSENIGRGYYKCSDSNDCTDKLISGIKQVFDMFMAEKGTKSAVHYESVVKKEFTKIGLGVSIHKSGNNFEFYLTTHYCTELK